MRRFFLEPGRWDDGFSLTGDEAKHCARVLRFGVGDMIEVFDGQGRGGEAEILETGKREIRLRLLKETPNPPGCGVTLIQALPKGKAFENILQKATELGVETIVPLVTQRSVARRDAGESPEKWRRILLEACKQCGRNQLPELLPAISFPDWLEKHADAGSRGFGSLEIDRIPLVPWAAALTGPPASVLIGPEGDLTSEECAGLRARGWAPLDFGPVILRSDTAALCALSVIGQSLRAPRA